jgi:hypothetical protein
MAGKNDNAQSKNISIKPTHIKAIQQHQQKHHFDSFSAALQDLLEFSIKNYERTFKKNLLTFFIFPMVFSFILNRISAVLYDVNIDLLKDGLEFPLLSQIAGVTGLMAIGFSLFAVSSAGIFYYITKKRGH